MSQAITPKAQVVPERSSNPIALRAELALPSSVVDANTTVRLRPSVAAPSLARNHVRWACATHQLPEHVVRDAAFVAGELVALSVRQLRAPLDFDISVGPDDVTVRIRDLGATWFGRSRPDDVGTGRALQLVACVSQLWGVSITPAGRQMWASIALHTRSEQPIHERCPSRSGDPK